MTDLEQIGVGNTPNDGNGDPLRTGGEKINANFTKLNKTRRIVCWGELQIYKGRQNGTPNTSIDNIEPNDGVSGFINDTIFVLFGQYVSGDPFTIAAYNQDSINYIDLSDFEDID